MPLTRSQSKAHGAAIERLQQSELTAVDRDFIIENFHEAGEGENKPGSAHFTPLDLANDFKLEIAGPTVIDLCAGIGALSYAYTHWTHHETPPAITCVEINPRYVEVGRKLLPDAEWICGDIFDPEIQAQLANRRFRTAIGNPPFGTSSMGDRRAPRYTGRMFEYALIDIASELADFGAFIIPQSSAPFRFSGVRFYHNLRSPCGSDYTRWSDGQRRAHEQFETQTGICLDVGVGIDTTVHQEGWRGVSPTVEIATCEFPDRAAFEFNTSINQVTRTDHAEQLSLL